MVWQLHVSGERFWDALSHCSSPVYLSGYRDSDLRLLSVNQRNAILPPTSSDLSMVSLDFYDKQDFVRFVLAYLLIENIYDLVGNCVVEISENLTPKQREK